MDFSKYNDEFIAFLQSKNRSNSTVIAYKKDIQQLLEYINKELPKNQISEITPEILQAYIDQITQTGGFTLKTVSRKINSLKTFFKYLLANKIVSTNPAAPIKHPKLEPTMQRILSPMEYRSLRDVARSNIRLFTMVEMLLQTGIRIGELSRLTRQDVDIEDKPVLKIAAFSSNPAREVELNENITAALKTYLQQVEPLGGEKDYLFYTKTGNPVLIRNIRTTLDRVFKKAGVQNATVNDIRNTFIVHQLQSGLKVDQLAKIVGHRKVSTTEKYLSLLTEKSKKAISKIVAL